MSARINPDALYREPPLADSAHPAGGGMLTITVGGCRLFGMLYLPQGPGPHPVTMMLHGLPGAVRGEDLAQAFRRAGMAAFIFSYRGSWGSEGTWSYRHCQEDVLAAYSTLRDPAVAAQYRLDPERVLVLGHSMGGVLAMMLARDAGVRDVILMSPADPAGQQRESSATPEARAKRMKRLAMLSEPLAGVDAQAIWDEYAEITDDFDLRGCIPHLTNQRFLLVGAQHDTILPPPRFFDPVVEDLERRMPGCVTTCVLPTGHNYNSHRMELAQTMLRWMSDMGY